MNDAIARIDAARLRRVNELMVTGAEAEYDQDPDVLLDLKSQSAAEMLADYERSMENFQTAPFDAQGEQLRFMEGGVTIWSGFPGSGKTSLLRQFACHLLARKQSVFFASLEEHPRNLAIGIASVACGVGLKQKITAGQFQAFLDKYQPQLRLWGKVGIASHRKLLAVIRKLSEQGVKHAVIDSLMCIDISNDDIERQRQFAVLVAATARASGVHIHLVAHPKKPMQNSQEPDINDVAGAKEIGGIADNVIFVRRGGTDSPSIHVPMKVVVKKQRHWTGEWPVYEGYFKHEWRQFASSPLQTGPIAYV